MPIFTITITDNQAIVQRVWSFSTLERAQTEFLKLVCQLGKLSSPLTPEKQKLILDDEVFDLGYGDACISLDESILDAEVHFTNSYA
jgi:hypothetical protein